jgi:ATP-independent RNA helicase DbpA
MNNKFSELPLQEKLLHNLETLGFKEMTPIQQESLPLILEGRDLIAQAKTGSGKTLAFGLGVLSNLHVKQFRIQALLICPTRELAAQVAAELRRIARALHNVKILELCGGSPMKAQVHSLSHGAHIIVGTPGRIQAHIDRASLSLEHVTTLVLDEADRMLDMGFYDDIVTIINSVKKERQTLLFSATFSDEIKSLAQSILNDPITVHVKSEAIPNQIDQEFYRCSETSRRSALFLLLGHYQKERIIIFCNTKVACDEIADTLYDSGIDALAIHSDLEQFDRDETLTLFTNGSCNVLVATDVAARGLDIEAVDMVLNYELPFDAEVYVHRIGRTGRAEKEGLAVSLCQGNEDILEAMHVATCKDLDVLDEKKTYKIHSKMRTLFISAGKKDKLRPGDIVGALTAQKSIGAHQIGTIKVHDRYAYVAVENDVAERALQILQTQKIKGREFRVRSITV